MMYTFAFFVLGALSGSFAGVLAERLNTGGSWVSGRSKCNSCARELGFADLLPIVSWLVSRGACFTCRSPVPVRYAVTEALFAVLFALSYARLGFSPALPVLLLAIVVLGALVLYDIRHTIVPETLSYALFALSAVFALMTSGDMHALGITILTAGCIGLGFFLLHSLSKGRAMGLGDAPVALSLSLLTGAAAVPGLLFSFWIGAVVGIVILVLRPAGHRMGIEVPFVPFLAAGFFLAFFTGWNPLTIVLP
jgi:prepilin signal peptidase PulO-like enzyme (type II secretory pathway)